MTQINRPISVLFVGEMPTGSSPLLTLARAVRLYGVRPVFSQQVESSSTSGWLRLVRKSDVILFVGYVGPSLYTIRQLALAASLGKPVVRWWVGSDVLHCLQHPAGARWARLADKLCAESVAVAPNLQTELSSIGLNTKLIPSVVDLEFLNTEPPHLLTGRDILVYLPTSRGSFYGEEVVRSTIEANPDLRFLVVADAEHRFEQYRNVESFGWVKDMRPVYDRAGCLLRITQHDGLPRMVIETLLLGKYVICSHELPGCWPARNFVDVQHWISLFRNSTASNIAGAAAMKALLTPAPEIQFANLLQRVAGESHVAARTRAILAIAPLTILTRVLNLV
jgi:hypothetical protein